MQDGKKEGEWEEEERERERRQPIESVLHVITK